MQQRPRHTRSVALCGRAQPGHWIALILLLAWLLPLLLLLAGSGNRWWTGPLLLLCSSRACSQAGWCGRRQLVEETLCHCTLALLQLQALDSKHMCLKEQLLHSDYVYNTHAAHNLRHNPHGRGVYSPVSFTCTPGRPGRCVDGRGGTA